MKILFTVFVTFFFSALYAQTKIFTIKDATTNKPIAFANVYYPRQMIGSISNDEGKVKIPVINNDTLLFSYIGYETKKIPINSLLKVSTIKLNPKTIELDEIKIYTIDLRERLVDVLANYERNYYKTKLYDATYKESFKVNNELKRLAQVQIKWWDKNYKYDFEKSFDKQNKVSLMSIDYSKRLNNNINLINGGYIENKYFFELLHLNHYLKFIIDYGKNISVDYVGKFQDYTKVVFNTNININGKDVSFLKKGIIYFDNQTGAISKLSFKLLYNTNSGFKKALTREKKLPYETKTQGQNIELTFTKNLDKKWGLSYFRHQLYGIVKYNNVLDKFYSKQELYITKVHRRGKISKKQQIDLNKPFYENLPMNKKAETKILLTNKELQFIHKKD